MLLSEKQNDKIAYTLIFLFPTVGISVRHWFSALFIFMVILSLTRLRENSKQYLEKDEKILLWLMFSFFAAFIVTSIVNGWTKIQTRYLEDEIRYLFFIPLYLMFRRLPEAGKWILYGSLLAIPFAMMQTVYDLFINKFQLLMGVYSNHLSGPFVALVGVLSLTAWPLFRKYSWYRWILPVFIVATVFMVAISGSRTAYIGFVVMLLVWVILSFPPRLMLVMLVALSGSIISVYMLSEHVSSHVDQAIYDAQRYIEMDNPASVVDMGSGDTRLEMLRTSVFLFKDNPVFGIGRGNWPMAVEKYIEQGRVSPMMARHGHPHNMFAEVAISMGVLGLGVFVLIFVYLFKILISRYKKMTNISRLGIVYLMGILTFGMFTVGPVVKGNFIAIFLVYTAIIISWLFVESNNRVQE